MPVGLVAVGTVATTTTTTLTVTQPAGFQAGDLLVLLVSTKAATPPTVTTPAGWIAPANNTITGGAGTAGVDTGPNRITLFYRVADGTEGNAALTLSAAPSPGQGVIVAFSKGAIDTWDPVVCGVAADTTGSGGLYDPPASATTIPLAAGDWIGAADAINGDAGTPTLPGTLTIAGVTLGTRVNQLNNATTVGNDARLIVDTAPYSSGTATAGPDRSVTYASGNSSMAGASVFWRLRATAGTPSGVTEVGTTPVVTGNTATITTASFTPAADTLLVAYAAMGNGAGGASSLGAITDSLGETWTRLVGDAVSGNGTAEIWVKDATPSPAAQTVTWDPGGAGASGLMLVVKWYAGAQPASQQNGPTAVNNAGNAYSLSLTTTAVDSLVAGALGRATGPATLTPNAGTTLIRPFSGSAGDQAALLRSASNTVTPGSVSYGFTNAASASNSIALVEILPTAAGGGGIVATVGQAGETDTAQPLAERKTRTVGQAGETDAAQPVAVRKVRPVGQAVTVDVAQPVIRPSTGIVAVGLAVETGLAQPLARRKARLVVQTVATDLSQPVARRKARLVVQTVEADTAQPATRRKTRAAGQTIETDQAQPAARRKARALGQATGVDAAQPVTSVGVLIVAVGQAAEVAAARPLAGAKARLVGHVVEVGAAQPVARAKTARPGQVVETDLAQLVTVSSRVVRRPEGGVVTRPNTGTTTRPATGTTARPNTGTTTRPYAGITSRP